MLLTRCARTVERAFDDRLVTAGSSASCWAVLSSLEVGGGCNQRELARQVGIRGASLTSQLTAMEAQGLIVRHRHPEKRGMHTVELTDAGVRAVTELRAVAVSFDRSVQSDIDADDLVVFSRVLAKMYANVVGRDPVPVGRQTRRPVAPGPGR